MQRRGIGTAIVRDLQRTAASLGVVLDIAVEHDNPAARRLYEHLGCIEVGRDERGARLRWRPSP